MEVSRIRALRGPNLWSRHTAIEAIVRCTEAERAISELSGFEGRVRALFPTIGALHPANAQIKVSVAHVLEAAALALQAQAGCPVTFSCTAVTVEPGVYQVVVEYTEEEVGRQAFDLAEQLVQAQQGRGGVAAAAAQSRREGDAFLEMDFDAVGDGRGVEERGGSLVHEVASVHWQRGNATSERDARSCRLHIELVAELHRLHDGLQLVKAILALAEDVEQQVDLAGGLADDGAQDKNAPTFRRPRE